ncbi:MAG: RNA-dependent DNA polymerase, partial [Moorea sp. SIO4A1]|uniref:reverse transcriptase domain-containing protein n=1 Tax=Moorena sp. SIO4A1 TaxID=2607835 RepID=UPI00144D6980
MVRLAQKRRELWRDIDWKKHQKILFRLQRRLYKAVREGDLRKARSIQRLILKSLSAKLLAIRQVTQLNKGKRTAGVDGKASLTHRQRFLLLGELNDCATTWKHSRLREIPIPKKNGKTRILKVPTIKDRAWQCLVKYALEPAHEATFHARSYGFRTGRSAHDALMYVHKNFQSNHNGARKRVIELDIKKCFDRISHASIMEALIAPKAIKQGIFRCLKAGINPEFPEQGTPQGGVVSPLLANIALNGIEEIHPSVRYADDMLIFLKPGDKAENILEKVKTFLKERGMEISEEKTRITKSTDGFDFLGWNFINNKKNGKHIVTPSAENYLAFRDKVKKIVNNSNYGAKVKAQKLAPIVRGWRNYHKFCKMDGSRNSLWFMNNDAFDRFKKEKKIDRIEAAKLAKKAFPAVKWKEFKHTMVQGTRSP